MTTARGEWLAGMRDELPILVGTVPFGLIYGVAAVGAGLPRAAAQGMSLIVFAGSAQFVAAQFIGSGVPGLLVVVTAFVINLRHALYSASLAPYTRHLPRRWRLLLAYLLTDEAYAVTVSHYAKPGEVRHKHWYFLGAGLALWCAWQASTALGVFLGASVPASWSLDFTLPLTFIALVVPALRDRAGVAAALVAGVVAVLALALPFKSGLLLATGMGIAVGLLLERSSARQRAATETYVEPEAAP
jgi:4-azaleucine resistance transporter AzlC